MINSKLVEYHQYEVVPLEADLRPFPGMPTCRLETASKRLAKRLAESEPLEGKRFQILCEEHHGYRLYRCAELGSCGPDELPPLLQPAGDGPRLPTGQSTLQVDG